MSWGRHILIPKRFILVSTGQVASEYDIDVASEKGVGILVGTAGTLNVTMDNDDIITGLPFTQGINLGSFTSIQDSSNVGDASNVWIVVFEPYKVK